MLVTRSWQQQRFVAEPHQVIEHVAEAVGELVGDERELATRQAPHHVALRQHDPPQRVDVALEREDVANHVPGRILEHGLLERVDAGIELVHLGPVVIDHQVDDAMHQRDRPLREQVLVPLTDLVHLLDACASDRRAR